MTERKKENILQIKLECIFRKIHFIPPPLLLRWLLFGYFYNVLSRFFSSFLLLSGKSPLAEVVKNKRVGPSDYKALAGREGIRNSRNFIFSRRRSYKKKYETLRILNMITQFLVKTYVNIYGATCRVYILVMNILIIHACLHKMFFEGHVLFKSGM